MCEVCEIVSYGPMNPEDLTDLKDPKDPTDPKDVKDPYASLLAHSAAAAPQAKAILDLIHPFDARDDRAGTTPLFCRSNGSNQRKHARFDLFDIDAPAAYDAIAPQRVERAIFEGRATPAIPYVFHKTSSLPCGEEATHHCTERNCAEDTDLDRCARNCFFLARHACTIEQR